MITARIAAELAYHEGIVREAYKDSVGVWTWGIGVTNYSGHNVDRYQDNPQSLERVFEVYEWLLREKYAPAVDRAFAGHRLSEAQYGAALSFHYNTGAIGRASWVKKWRAGDITGAKKAFMNWSRPDEIVDRRRAERDLFFDGKWTNDGHALVYPVRKPSYSPDWGRGKRMDILPALEAAFAGAVVPKPVTTKPVIPKPEPRKGFLAHLFSWRK